MIKANELRVGNKILSCFDRIETVRSIYGHEGYKERTDVHEIYKHLVCVEECGNQYNLGEIKPIPITEEWLLNAGFNQESIFGYHVKYSLNKIEIWHDRGNGTFLLDNIKNKKVYLKYVHQLQNICFELGEELTFKM